MARNHVHIGPLGAAELDRGDERRLAWAVLLIGGFMVVEVAGGILSGSLALLADAGHMLTDFGSLVLALVAARVSRRPADWRRTYGFGRVQVLAAFINALALFAIAIWIVIEAIRRLFDPVEVQSTAMLVVAAAGLVVNVIAYYVLHGAERSNLNVRGAAIHVIGDLAGSLAAIAAALIIMFTGWSPADPILSALVAAVITASAVPIAREAGHILLEGAPEGVDVREIETDLQSHLDVVEEIHHVHAWLMTQDSTLVTLHARVSDQVPPEHAAQAIKQRLRERFGIDHATVEIEHAACAGEDCHPAPRPH